MEFVFLFLNRSVSLKFGKGFLWKLVNKVIEGIVGKTGINRHYVIKTIRIQIPSYFLFPLCLSL